jgi:hypothetical protein
MIGLLFMAAASVAALIIVVPTEWLRKVLGYVVIGDILGSWYLVATYASTGTVSGLQVAVFGALILTITLRAMRRVVGYSRYEIDGDSRLAALAAASLTQAIAWARAVFFAAFRGGKINPPTPLGGQWVYHPPRAPSWLFSWGVL